MAAVVGGAVYWAETSFRADEDITEGAAREAGQLGGITTPTPTQAAATQATEPAHEEQSAEDLQASFADVFERQHSGIARLDVVSCDGGGIGSGFLIARDLVATAAHVVHEHVAVGVHIGGETTVGSVVGFDAHQDLALVRTARRVDGHVFSFAGAGPRVGDPVAAFGFPVGESLTFTQGTVSGVDEVYELADGEMDGMLKTDTVLNYGNSGGPLVNEAGEVVGVVVLRAPHAEGISYAVGAPVVERRMERWAQTPQARPAADCPQPLGPSETSPVGADRWDHISEEAGWTLVNYFVGINAGDYAFAWQQLSPAAQERNSYPDFAAGLATTYNFDFDVRAVTFVDVDTVVVYLAFTSLQAPGYGPEGEACTHWTLDYTIRWFSTGWLIDHVSGHDSGPAHRPCM